MGSLKQEMLAKAGKAAAKTEKKHASKREAREAAMTAFERAHDDLYEFLIDEEEIVDQLRVYKRDNGDFLAMLKLDVGKYGQLVFASGLTVWEAIENLSGVIGKKGFKEGTPRKPSEAKPAKK